jgi:hypothetical protein
MVEGKFIPALSYVFLDVCEVWVAECSNIVKVSGLASLCPPRYLNDKA